MDVLFAFALTLLAGISTGIGSLFAFFSKKNNQNFLAATLGFSAGVMIYVSMVEIFSKAQTFISGEIGENAGSWVTVAAFFAGIIFIALLDKFLPKEKDVYQLSSNRRKKQYIKNAEKAHVELPSTKSQNAKTKLSKNKKIVQKNQILFGVGINKVMQISIIKQQQKGKILLNKNLATQFKTKSVAIIGASPDALKQKKLLRMGVFTALAIAIHNFPEGLATFMSALQEPGIAVAVAIAIAIHNIPEGIAVAMPIFYATGNRKKAFFFSFFSGLTEPVGAIIGYLIFLPIMSDLVFGIVFAAVAGIMVFISLDELLPSAREYGKPYLSMYGLIGGMIVMAVSLLLFM